MTLVARYLALVKFEHTIFALPFALISLLVAANGRPAPATLFWVLAAMVGRCYRCFYICCSLRSMRWLR